MIFEVVKFAKQKNVTVIFDPNVRKSLWGEAEARTTLIELSALADVVLPGLEEGEFLFGTNDPERIGNMFLENGAKKVILKSGKDGTYFFDKTSSDYIPAFKLEQVIDPVGAGDGFAAGYLSGKLDGLEDIESIKRGNAVGALVTQALGDVEGLPEKEEIQEFIEQLNSDITR
ncbi:PfkB family carbohydrate kinase [Sinobaca sp. H24]|uniref:carbohydrate kinase family protein n=1 Tax=Sinobaca sp. H24 TaxID=2923376 RepID=UPI0027E3355C|nr:PfkB family carbohydrate kinase [Sinobaca sp. H24]